jgi:serine/threonine-protein kinase
VSLKKLGRYDLVRVLGKGAMGIVYEGRDPNLDRRVAIKTVKVENLSEEAAAEYEARFRTEARSAARLQHPNIVSVYDSDRDGDIAFLVMEYIQGDDLKHHLDKGVRYTLEQSLKMIRDLLSALDYAHKQGIVHRDIKPANLLIEPGGRVKLTDFGVARIQDSGEATRTQGSMVGTLKYMSPEQVQGQKTDSRADLFSVGVVLYQLLTDKRPFDGDNDFSIIHQIIGHTPPAPSSFNARLPSAIDAVVARALAKDREERFATARDFASALQSAIRRAEDATVIPPADPSKRPDPAGTGSKEQSIAGFSNAPTSPSTVTQEVELVYWKDIKDSTDPAEFEGFLAKFPAGIYADLARRRLRKLTGGNDAPDQTVLSGGAASRARGDHDLEATRARTATVPLVVPGSPADAEDDYTRTIVQPRVETELMDAGEREPETALDASDNAAEPAARPRRWLPVAAVAGLAGVAIAGVAAILIAGKSPAPAKSASGSPPAIGRQASTPPAGVATAKPGPTSVPANVAQPVAAHPTAASTHAAGSPAAKASAPRRTANAAKVRPTETAKASPAPHRDDSRQPPMPAPTPVQTVARSSVDSCRDKVFLLREFCLAEQCDKPGARSHPLCVQRREEARIREESRIRP